MAAAYNGSAHEASDLDLVLRSHTLEPLGPEHSVPLFTLRPHAILRRPRRRTISLPSTPNSSSLSLFLQRQESSIPLNPLPLRTQQG